MPGLDEEARKLSALLMNTLHDDDLKQEKLRLGFGYPGSKIDQLEHIIPRLPSPRHADVFVDGCGGSGAISLNCPDYGLHVFNDKCSGVTAYFRCLQKPDTLLALTERIEVMVYSKEEWLFCRDSWEELHDDLVERAARWFYTVHCSYSSKGKEWGRVRKPVGEKFGRFGKIAKNAHFLHDKASRWQIENDDLIQLALRYDSSRTAFYFDPTYYDCTPGMYGHEMSKQYHVRLLNLIQNLEGFVAISGYPNDLYDKQYDWDERYEWKHTKTTLAGIACEANNFQGHVAGDVREQSTEVLWIKEFK